MTSSTRWTYSGLGKFAESQQVLNDQAMQDADAQIPASRRFARLATGCIRFADPIR